MPEHLHYSPQAQLDLDEIFDYFAVELENPEKGSSIVAGILAAAKKIPGHATRFPPVGPLPFMTDEYRFVPVGSYVIFFRTEGKEVTKLNLSDSMRRFPPRFLRGRTRCSLTASCRVDAGSRIPNCC